MSEHPKKAPKLKKKAANKYNITVKVDASFEQVILAGLNYDTRKKAQ